MAEVLRIFISACFFVIGLLIFGKGARIIFRNGLRAGYVDILTAACFVIVGLMIWLRHIP